MSLVAISRWNSLVGFVTVECRDDCARMDSAKKRFTKILTVNLHSYAVATLVDVV